MCVRALALSPVRLCDSTDGSPPGSSVRGIFQAIILEWVAISFSRGSSWPKDQTWVSCVSCIGRWIPREAPLSFGVTNESLGLLRAKTKIKLNSMLVLQQLCLGMNEWNKWMIHSFIVCLFSQESESLRTGALSVLLLALSWCPEQWLILPQLSDEWMSESSAKAREGVDKDSHWVSSAF